MTPTPPLDPSGHHRSNRTSKGRTSLVTAAAIAGVLVAGTAAVAANMGILNAADTSAIGDLAATDELLPATGAAFPTVVVDQQSSPSTTSTATTSPTNGTQQYDIDDTGTVWIATTTGGLALDHVLAEAGWIPTLSQNDPTSLRIDFTNGARTIVFTAALAEDGSVVVDVTEPTTVVAAAPTRTAGRDDGDTAPVISVADDSYGDDDSYEDDSYEDDSYEEHEGADDDD